ncbi:hypothetical protein B0H15DRAFT_810694 [Mycena belliarum]|uniref:F-box domain-containing protein n=1 Tax=Mycena belliarum TaxID=1033014 RepID=A0AAD6UGS8_9AGAR|nr:hypothetical protein B0H15DRAFT_810694 [Mycena belliae]
MLRLPTELVICILNHIPLSTLNQLPALSQQWSNFFEENQSILYRNAAVLHGFVPSTAIVYSDLEAIQSGSATMRNRTALSRRSLIGVSDWKSFCRRQISLRDAWRGEASSYVTMYRSSLTRRSNVHRIKVDEQRGFAIVTSSAGGIRAVDLATDQRLWSLSRNDVHPYAHCEYDSGYLIFDRTDGDKEVWRVADDVETTKDLPTFAFPDDKQKKAWSLIADLGGHRSRGCFNPWMVLKPPDLTKAFRFVFPTLIAATHLSLFLWDIPTGELVQVIRDIQNSSNDVHSSASLGPHITYVEVSETHAFVCGSHALRAFSRSSGRCVLDIPSSQLSYGNNTYSFLADGSHKQGWLSSSVLKPQPLTHSIVAPDTSGRQLINQFTAVHVSACGSHLAALLADSRLIIIPFFQRVINKEADIREISLEIQLGSPANVSRYLAFEHGRVAVATGTGLFVINVDFESAVDPPDIIVHRAAWFNAPVGLKSVSCLQMSPTCIFLNWDVPLGGSRHLKDDDLIPDSDDEEIFNASLADARNLVHLANGNDIVQLFEPGGVQITSVLCSIDFAPSEFS